MKLGTASRPKVTCHWTPTLKAPPVIPRENPKSPTRPAVDFAPGLSAVRLARDIYPGTQHSSTLTWKRKKGPINLSLTCFSIGSYLRFTSMGNNEDACTQHSFADGAVLEPELPKPKNKSVAEH